jgi:hypothetical protein
MTASDQESESASTDPSPKRRRLLKAAGVSVTGALAGCSQSRGPGADGDANGTDAGDGRDNGSGTGGDGGSGGEPMDDTFSGTVWTNPADAQYNPYNPGTSRGSASTSCSTNWRGTALSSGRSSRRWPPSGPGPTTRRSNSRWPPVGPGTTASI